MLGEGIEQLQVFAVFAVLGLALTAVYLFFMGLFKSRLATIIFDAIYGAAAIYAVFITNLSINNGQFRLFIFVALALGAIIGVATCKTLLDKASSALYNLFTTKTEDDVDGLRVSQQKDIDTDSSGSSVGTGTGVHAADNALPDFVAKPTHRKTSKPNRRVEKARRSHARANRIYENRRVRQTLGRKQRKDLQRRHFVDSGATGQ